MGVIKTSGSATGTSTPVSNKYISTPTPENPASDVRMMDKRYVSDTFNYRNELNVTRSAEILKDLRGVMQGSKITVTYFKQAQERSVTESTDALGYETVILDKVHTCTLMIHNCILVLTGPMSYEYDAEQTVSNLSGEAVTYPNFLPSMGDMFLYEMNDGSVGLFEITAVPERLSVRYNTCHKITFSLVEIVNNELMTKILGSVTQEAYFELNRFLAENGALLKTEEYQLIKLYKEKVPTLLNYYFDTFFESLEYNSLVRPDMIYDPYIVELFKLVISREVIPIRPLQLLASPPYLRRSIWWRLLFPDQVNDDLMLDMMTVNDCKVRFMSTMISALAGRTFLTLLTSDINTTKVCYSEDCLTADHTKSAWRLIDNYFTSQTINTTTLINAINNVYQEPIEQQFYTILVYVVMMQKVMHSLESGHSVIEDVTI